MEKKMSVVEKLKAESLRLRKERNPIAPAISFALSQIAAFGKNNGNRETTEDEAIGVLKRIIVTLEEIIRFDTLEKNDDRVIALSQEKQILESVLPQMVSEDEVRAYLAASFVEAPQNKGVAMKVLKTKFGALVDMKRAGEIISEMYGV